MRAVNLTKLESRPTKTGLGRYIFFIDIEGSRERDLPVDAAITAIEEQGVARVNFLGLLPRRRRVRLESPRAGEPVPAVSRPVTHAILRGADGASRSSSSTPRTSRSTSARSSARWSWC